MCRLALLPFSAFRKLLLLVVAVLVAQSAAAIAQQPVTISRVVASGDAHLEFACEVKPYLMSALAKSYGNASFTKLWAARSVLKNTGDSAVSDYRIRFRIADYSAWSNWQRCNAIAPGDEVAAPFFPVLDVEKLARMTSARQAMLEIEFEFRRADGELVRETESQQIQLLSRNQVVFSSRSRDEISSFHEAFDFVPVLLSSMVSAEDPAMQQLAGAISGLAGGVAASTSDDDAVKYLAALFIYLSDNGVAYQTPPNFLIAGTSAQHVKYGRDVLRNRAGTCVDLAVLFASACEAVGLNPVLVLIEGHCFPACYLPSGKLVAIEATGIGKVSFADAVSYGMEELEEAQRQPAYFINIAQSRAKGLSCIDLPEVPVNFLGELGYRTGAAPAANATVDADKDDADEKGASEDGGTENGGDVQPASYELEVEEEVKGEDEIDVAEVPAVLPSSSALPALAGIWVFDKQFEDVHLTIVEGFAADGGYAGRMRIETADGKVKEGDVEGQWSIEGDKLVVRTDDGAIVRPFKFEDGTLWVYFPEFESSLGFLRAE
jgi:hypothetical protein